MSLRDTLRARAPPARDTDDSRRARGRAGESRVTVEAVLWIVVVAGMAADVALTLVGRQVGLVEVNPIARDALRLVGGVGLLGMKGGALALGVALRSLLPPAYTAVVPLGLAVPTIPAVVHNAVLVATALL